MLLIISTTTSSIIDSNSITNNKNQHAIWDVAYHQHHNQQH